MPSSSLRLITLRAALGVAIFFAVDSLLFRSGFYFRIAAPGSAHGHIARVLDDISRMPLTKRGIVVTGDSRIGEGFSARVATHTAANDGSPLRFASGAIPASLPRVWYYLLRQTPEAARRLQAVAIMLPSYHDDDAEPEAERATDIVLVHPLLRLSDLTAFPPSFLTYRSRLQAAEAILFSGLFYGKDLRDLLADPPKRIQQVNAWRQHGYEWASRYGGRAESVEELRFNMETGALTMDPGRLNTQPTAAARFAYLRRYGDVRRYAELRRYASMLRYRGGRPPENARASAYRKKWLGRIADWCRDHQVDLIAFRVPRGPLHFMVDADETPSGVVAEMSQANRLRLLPAATFNPLERPENFFDSLHLNRFGREVFSAELARAVIKDLPDEKRE
jgi:hypothetical protein